MFALVTLDSFRFNDIKQRLLKVLRFGKDDVREPFECAPFGLDSGPLKGMVAVYGPTTASGQNVIVGYLQQNQIAKLGESRLYALDANGNLQLYLHLKNDGTAELGGTAHNLLRYAPLNTELQSFKDMLNIELAKIQTGIAAAGGSYTPATLTLDISAAKIDEIKTL